MIRVTFTPLSCAAISAPRPRVNDTTARASAPLGSVFACHGNDVLAGLEVLLPLSVIRRDTEEIQGDFAVFQAIDIDFHQAGRCRNQLSSSRQVIAQGIEDAGGVFGRIPAIAALVGVEEGENPRDEWIIGVVGHQGLQYGRGDLDGVVAPAREPGGSPVNLVAALLGAFAKLDCELVRKLLPVLLDGNLKGESMAVVGQICCPNFVADL